MRLKLERPLVFFDLETTGVDILNDRIVEISIVKLIPGQQDPIEYVQRVNPGRPIPPEATNVHHITDEDVKDSPAFKDIAGAVAKMFENSDIGGFNSNKFDLPLLIEELARVSIVLDLRNTRLVDVQNIFHKKEPRNLTAAYRFYCDKELEGAHSALADTKATVEVFKAQVERYADLPDNISGLSDFSSYAKNVDLMGRFIKNDKDEIMVNFGKYKGRPLKMVLKEDPSYYDWMMKSDFPMNTKQVLTSVYNAIKAK